MGQAQSQETREVSQEQLTRELTLKFAKHGYTQLELYCFKEVFGGLAEEESGLRYWSETTLCKFLELPDVQLGAVLHQLVSNLAAFPFMSQGPSIMTIEAMLRVITLLTDRYKRVLKRGHNDRLKLLFTAMAVYDRRASSSNDDPPELSKSPVSPEENAMVEAIKGFDIDQPANDGPDDEDDDELMLAALDSLDAIEAIGLGERRQVQHSFIPSDNFLRLVELLLLIASLGPQDKLSIYFEPFADEANSRRVHDIASAIVASFGIEDHPGVMWSAFKTVVPNSLPFLLSPLSPLFEHFLFEKDFDLSKRKHTPSSPTETPQSPRMPSPRQPQAPVPIIEKQGEILTTYVLTQLSFFISPTTLFGRLHPLYSSGEHGFSMGSFENHVFNWYAPSLLLVTGTILPTEPSSSRERAVADCLPPRNKPSSVEVGTRVTYGAYIPVQWRSSHKSCFGDHTTLLFQLSPTHDVFHASELSQNYISYMSAATSSVRPGINFGTALPTKSTHAAEAVPLGPVSLFLDDSLEYGVFSHSADGGGSFHPSVSPTRSGKRRGASTSITEARRRPSGALSEIHGSSKGDWQDRFEIECLEVWGFGGEKEAERMKRNKEFDEREAKMRRQSILGASADMEGEREILRMAGLLPQRNSGGSIG